MYLLLLILRDYTLNLFEQLIIGMGFVQMSSICDPIHWEGFGFFIVFNLYQS